MPKPSWWKDGLVVMSTAPTVGINKDGQELYAIDEATGRRTDVIADQLRADVDAILSGSTTDSVQWIPSDSVRATGIAVPAYYNARVMEVYEAERARLFPGFRDVTLGQLIDDRWLTVTGGHGSPSADMRTGSVPYIKVSDLRAGQVNINPTNLVSEVTARTFWRGANPDLRPFDLLTPARTSKNIGDFAVLMPGQERVVLTKEILVMRPTSGAPFDSFFLLWALTLSMVRQQWQRVVPMQTNREDTGGRFREITIPLPEDEADFGRISAPFRTYYEGVATLRESFLEYLHEDDAHHVFLTSVPATDEDASPDEE